MKTPQDEFTVFACKLLDSDWNRKDIRQYLDLAVLGWNTALISKPERIKKIEAYIEKNNLHSVTINGDRYDTLELVVALAHIKKALFPGSKNRINSAEWQTESQTISVS